MSLNSFVYDIPTKVYFGEAQWKNLKTELVNYGPRILFVYGGGSIKSSGLYDELLRYTSMVGTFLVELSGIEPNPKIDKVRQGSKICKEQDISAILAVGGGSVIDTAKFIAAGACYDVDPWEFLTAETRPEKALPIIAIPTIAATGSEMNYSGVITNPETNQKIARGYNCMKPSVAFLQPELTYSVDSYQTACGVVDIISHVIEVYFNTDKGFFMLDSIMESIMKTVLKFGKIAIEEPNDYEARANLMWASSWAINGFIVGGRKQSWSCHPIEHELSAFYDITHGLGMAILLPRWLKHCANENTLERYVCFSNSVIGCEMGTSSMDIAAQCVHYLEGFFFDTLALPNKLSDLGVDSSRFSEIADRVCGTEGYLDGFVRLYKDDVKTILSDCL